MPNEVRVRQGQTLLGLVMAVSTFGTSMQIGKTYLLRADKLEKGSVWAGKLEQGAPPAPSVDVSLTLGQSIGSSKLAEEIQAA